MAMPSAKGLFHKAINQSGSFRMNMLEKNTTQAIAAEVLKALNLQPEQADSLQEIPFQHRNILLTTDSKIRKARTLP